MRADLGGREALVAGAGAADAIATRLTDNGAVVVRDAAVAGRLDMLVVCDAGLEEVAALIRAAAAPMVTQGSGRIVVVGSVVGLVGVRGGEAFAAANAGLFAFTRSMALELAGSGVLVNAVAAMAGEPAVHARLVSHTPLGRVARAEEVANAVLFLVAPASSYVTGHVLTVDGGWSAGFARDF